MPSDNSAFTPEAFRRSDERRYWRYEFAKAAMAGLLSHPNGDYGYQDAAEYAVSHADALLAELEKPREADEHS